MLRCETIPKPPTGDVDLPSGYKPARGKQQLLHTHIHVQNFLYVKNKFLFNSTVVPTDYPYFIERTKNYMQPVYLERSYRGMRKITKINKIQGDIWALDRDLKKYLEERTGVKTTSRIHEFAGIIKIKGDYVNRVKEMLDEKGF